MIGRNLESGLRSSPDPIGSPPAGMGNLVVLLQEQTRVSQTLFPEVPMSKRPVEGLSFPKKKKKSESLSISLRPQTRCLQAATSEFLCLQTPSQLLPSTAVTHLQSNYSFKKMGS